MSTLTEIANIADQKVKIDKYKALMEQYFAQKNVDKLKEFVVHSMRIYFLKYGI